jgi:DNA-binding NtrC family response regulator
MVKDKDFRQDLLYRINTVEIKIPPLHDRPEDIPLLLDHFLKIYCKKYNKPLKRISAATQKKLEKYRWPGNVRELQHAIERAIIMSDSQVLQPSDFLFASQETKEAGLLFDDYNLEEVEKALIRKVISKHGGNISHTAKELGLSRTALYRRLEKYGL